MTGLSVKKFSAFKSPGSLPPGAVHLWLCRANTAYSSELLDDYQSILTPAEIERSDRIQNSEQRQRFVLTRALVRTVLSQYQAVSPAQWRFAESGKGKPYIESPGSSLQFNLSHAGGWIVAALSLDSPLGVDVERCNPQRNLLRLAERFYGEEEFLDVRSRGGMEQVDRFYDYWTLKEAWLKATGSGVSGGLRSIVFSLGERGSLNYRMEGVQQLATFMSWQLEREYRLSLCRRGDALALSSVKIYGVEPLLKNWEYPLSLRYCSTADGAENRGC